MVRSDLFNHRGRTALRPEKSESCKDQRRDKKEPKTRDEAKPTSVIEERSIRGGTSGGYAPRNTEISRKPREESGEDREASRKRKSGLAQDCFSLGKEG